MRTKNSKNPWLADAAPGSTGETYEIWTVADFLKVPESRRRICLREFHAWMVLQEGVTDLLCSAGDALETPIPREVLHWDNDVYRWIDDGKATISGQIQPIVAQPSSGSLATSDISTTGDQRETERLESATPTNAVDRVDGLGQETEEKQ